MLHITLLWWVKSCISWQWHAQNLRGVKFIFKIVLFAIACISSECETLWFNIYFLFRFAFFCLLCNAWFILACMRVYKTDVLWMVKSLSSRWPSMGHLIFFVILISAMAFGLVNTAGHYLKAPHLLFVPACNRNKVSCV